jgi:hypothetical protein
MGDLDIRLIKPLSYKAGKEKGAPSKTIDLLEMREAEVIDFAHMPMGNPLNSQLIAVVANCVKDEDVARAVLRASGRNLGVIQNWIARYMGEGLVTFAKTSISDDAIVLYEPIKVKEDDGDGEKIVEVKALELREPSLDDLGEIPVESVTTGHCMELVAKCAINVPMDSVRHCSAMNTMSFVAWALNFIASGQMTGQIV